MHKILVISGKMGSGKTTLGKSVAEAWQKYKGNRAIFINFADAIYDIHDFCIGYLRGHGIVRDIKKDGPLLQLLGTEWGRKTISENVWVDLLKSKIAKASAPDRSLGQNQLFIVSDCCFKNEFDAMEDDALMVRLECQRDLRRLRCEQWRDNEFHQSEVDLDEYADQGKFDLLFDTQQMSVESCTKFIMERLK